MNTFEYVIVSVITGMIWGAIPMIYGASKGRLGLAFAGFFSCTVGGYILGMLLAIPLAGIFTYLIAKKTKETERAELHKRMERQTYE